MTEPAQVTLNDLKVLFVGDWIHDDNRWETTPCYSVKLAYEIARRCDCTQDFQLRQVLYGNTPVDNVPTDAIDAISLAAQRYRQTRDAAVRRGL